MTLLNVDYDKQREHRRRFDTLPNVLIHDPARRRAYYLSADDLSAFRATPDTWAKLDNATVTFVIPDGELVDEVPSFLRVPEPMPLT